MSGSTTGTPKVSGTPGTSDPPRAARRTYWPDRAGLLGLTVLALIMIAAAGAPLIIEPHDLDVTAATGPSLAPPSSQFPLGTDETGRSVLPLTVWGARISLTVGLLATALGVGLGALVGVIAGHFPGWPTALLVRVTDWFLVLPALPLAVALAAVLDRGILAVVLAVAATTWAGVARVIRAQVLAVEASPFLERAKALGGGHWHQLRIHVLPAILPLVFATATLNMANAILAEATLSFLGLGEPGQVSWGSMLRHAITAGAVTTGAWWYLLPPGAAITVVVLTFGLCGRSLESSFGPTTRAR
jgi:peptide/nickel transport system permease protein